MSSYTIPGLFILLFFFFVFEDGLRGRRICSSKSRTPSPEAGPGNGPDIHEEANLRYDKRLDRVSKRDRGRQCKVFICGDDDDDDVKVSLYLSTTMTFSVCVSSSDVINTHLTT